MTTIFDGYDEEYRALTSDISKKISEIATYEDQQGQCGSPIHQDARWYWGANASAMGPVMKTDKKKTSIVHVGGLITQAQQLVRGDMSTACASRRNGD